MTPLPSLPWAVRSDPGLRRSSNEDSYCDAPGPRPLRRRRRHGRPRRRRGRVARRRRAIRPSSRRPPAPTRTAPGRSRSIRRSASKPTASRPRFRLANRRIANAIADSQDLRGMATTASARSARAAHAPCVAHVGDSRVYVLRDGRARADHARSLVGRGAGARRDDDARPRRGSIRGATSSRARCPAARIRRWT